MAELPGNKAEATVQSTDSLDIDQAVEALLADPDKDNSDGEPDDKGDDDPVEAGAAAEETEEPAGDTQDPEDPDLDATGDDAGDDQEPGDPDEGDDAEGGDTEEYAFEVDGNQVTLEEARLGYLRQSDYTRKTSEVAENRKALEADKDSVAAERQQYATMLDTLKQQIAGEGEEPDWVTLEATSDPVEFLQAKEKWRDQKDRLGQIEAETQKVSAAQAQLARDSLAETVHREREALLEALPEWRDKTVAKAEQTEIRSFMKELGFSDAEAENVLDHRVVQALRFGLKGWKMETKAKPIAKKKAAAARPIKGKARSAPQSKSSVRQRQATERFHETGDLHDAVNMMVEAGGDK